MSLISTILNFVNLPTSSATPTASNQLATKAYVDGATPTGVAYLANTQTFTGTNTFNVPIITSGASITSNTIPVTSVVGTAAALSGTQTFTGTNTFSAPPVMSGASITSSTIPAASVVGTAATLAATQTFVGTNTFSVAPVMSGSSIQVNTIPANAVVNTAAVLSGANTFSNSNSYSQLPTAGTTGSPLLPTATNQFVTKAYADSLSGFTTSTAVTTDDTTLVPLITINATATSYNIFGFFAATDPTGNITNTAGGFFNYTYNNDTTTGLTFLDQWEAVNAGAALNTTVNSPFIQPTVVGSTPGSQQIQIVVKGVAATTINWNAFYVIVTV